MKISVSTSNKKTNNIPSFSLLPGVTCSAEACKTCLKNCYAKRMVRLYSNVKKAWTNNTHEAQTDLDGLKNQLIAWLTLNDPKYFRVHVGGDFFSREYLEMWVDVARAFPGTIFFGYTKRADIFRDYPLPENFRFYYSAWIGCELPENINLPIAWYQDGTETRIPENTPVCAGNCKVCKHCIKCENDVVFMKH